MFKYLAYIKTLVILIIIVVAGYFTYKGVMFIWPYISPLVKWLKDLLGIKDPPIPCGGCYDEEICDEKLNKCRKNCKNDESFYDIGTNGICCNNTTHEVIEGVCIPKCPEGQKRCGNTDCFDPIGEECVDGKICKNQFVANKQTETGEIVKKCCGKDETGTQLYPKNGECVNCLGQKCGSNCCPEVDNSDAKDLNHPENKNPGTKCVLPDFCCNPKFVGKDDITGKEVCCQNELCGDKCCSGNKTCNKDTGKCQIKCGEEFCPDDSDLCVNNKGTLKCYPSTCEWVQTNYVPPAIYDITGGVQNLRSVCLAGGNSIISDKPMVAVSGVNPNMNSDTFLSLKSTEKNQRCKSLDACLGKIQQLGLENVIYKDTFSIKDGNSCQGKVNCSELLPTMDELKSIYGYTQDSDLNNGYYNKTLCPAKKEDGTDDVNCCYDRNTKEFNGYVCPNNQSCYNDIFSDSQFCYKKGSTKPDSHNLFNCSGIVEPKIEKNTLTCNCPQGTHAGRRCQYNNVNNCSNNGTVTTDKDDKPICICNPGYVDYVDPITKQILKCGNIKILKDSDISLAGVISGVCDWCHIVAGPGVSLVLIPAIGTVEYKPDGISTKLFGSVTASTVSVNYVGKYKKAGEEFTFTGNVSLAPCTLNYKGNYPQVTGTDNFVIKGSTFLKNAAVVVIGIPIRKDILAGTGTSLRYIDWDGYDCAKDDVVSTNSWGCGDPKFETCCKTNLSIFKNCDYASKPCSRDSPYLTPDKAAFNKSIVDSKQGNGGYYYI